MNKMFNIEHPNFRKLTNDQLRQMYHVYNKRLDKLKLPNHQKEEELNEVIESTQAILIERLGEIEAMLDYLDYKEA